MALTFVNNCKAVIQKILSILNSNQKQFLLQILQKFDKVSLKLTNPMQVIYPIPYKILIGFGTG